MSENIRFMWKSDRGMELMVEKTASIECRIDICELPTWWRNNVKSQTTKVPLVCTKCNFKSLQMISNVAKGHRMNCNCNKRVPWASERGRDALLSLLGHKKLQLESVPSWALLNARTVLSTKCLTCGVVGMISINHLCKWDMKCFCNRGIDYADERWRLRLMQIFTNERHLKPAGPLLSAEEWRRFNPNKKSKISFTCTRCSSEVEVCIPNFVYQTNRGSCLCRWKTQRMVTEFARTIPGYEVKSEFVLSAAISTMPFDIALIVGGKCVCIVEIDGSQHFSYNTNRMFKESDVERTRCNDIKKESTALGLSCSVVRMIQEDVWNSKFDWKSWLKTAVEFVRSSKPCIVVQSPELYGRGVGVPGFDVR